MIISHLPPSHGDSIPKMCLLRQTLILAPRGHIPFKRLHLFVCVYLYVRACVCMYVVGEGNHSCHAVHGEITGKLASGFWGLNSGSQA